MDKMDFLFLTYGTVAGELQAIYFLLLNFLNLTQETFLVDV